MRIPTGCRFRSRCWHRERLGGPARCADEDPSLIGDAHTVACHYPLEQEGASR
jgi:ABC-type antimicrobial peptide transport system ATPase subunit